MPAIRPWTLGERLLTESCHDRVLRSALAPAHSAGHSTTMSVSSGLFSPPTTILCTRTRAGGLCVRLRKAHQRSRWLSCFSCRTPSRINGLPLELHFEHRNYLPAVFMFCRSLCDLFAKNANRTAPPYAIRVCHALAILLPLAGHADSSGCRPMEQSAIRRWCGRRAIRTRREHR